MHVPGINTLTAQMLLTEVGPDLSRFPTAAAFCSWLSESEAQRRARFVDEDTAHKEPGSSGITNGRSGTTSKPVFLGGLFSGK
jgi:hypothetical protein